MNHCLLNTHRVPGTGTGAAGDTEVMSLDDKLFVNLEMGIPDYLTCLLRNLCEGQEAS